MPPTTRTRSARRLASSAATTLSDIKSFAKVIKNQPPCSSISKESPIQSTQSKELKILGKRKRDSAAIAQEDEKRKPKTTCAQVVSDDTKTAQIVPRTPQKVSVPKRYLPSPSPTPSKRLDLSLSSPQAISPSKERSKNPTQNYGTPPPTPSSERLVLLQDTLADEKLLPLELLTLTDLFGSLLKALALHIAHHGIIAPIDIQSLIQPTSKIWGVRKVTLDDIRRCLGIVFLQGDDMRPKTSISPQMRLFDYGRGKICIELEHDDGLTRGLNRLFDEETFKKTFSSNLHYQWKAWQSLDENRQDQNADSFVIQLPLFKITLCHSLKKCKSSIMEGQRRLEDLKSLVKNATVAPERVLLPTNSCKKDPQNRCNSLFERLKMKEKQKASLPLPPTKFAQDRKAALQRLPEIVQILSFSQAAGQRTSLSLTAAIERVQSSAKSSLSKDEIENCIKILAREIGQGFVTLVDAGSAMAVVIDPRRKPKHIEILIREVLEA